MNPSSLWSPISCSQRRPGLHNPLERAGTLREGGERESMASKPYSFWKLKAWRGADRIEGQLRSLIPAAWRQQPSSSGSKWKKTMATEKTHNASKSCHLVFVSVFLFSLSPSWPDHKADLTALPWWLPMQLTVERWDSSHCDSARWQNPVLGDFLPLSLSLC